VHQKRGIEGIKDNGVILDFKGAAVHDCWSSYWKADDVEHAVCCAHLMRELNGIKESEPKHKWSPAFFKLLLEMKMAKEKALEANQNALSHEELKQFDNRYDEILKIADRECPEPPEPEVKKRGKKKKGKERCLIERLVKFKEQVTLFAHKFIVPFTNNEAERSVRMCKVKSKVAGCFRTKEGADDYIKISSYIKTAKKHGYNAFEALELAFSGQDLKILEPRGSE